MRKDSGLARRLWTNQWSLEIQRLVWGAVEWVALWELSPARKIAPRPVLLGMMKTSVQELDLQMLDALGVEPQGHRKAFLHLEKPLVLHHLRHLEEGLFRVR